MPRFQLQTLGEGCRCWHPWKDFSSREEAIEFLHVGVEKLWWNNETEPGTYLSIPTGAHFIQPGTRLFVKVEGSSLNVWRGTWEPATDADISSFFAKTMEGDGYAYWCPTPFGGLLQCDLRCEEFEWWTWSGGLLRVTGPKPAQNVDFPGKQDEILNLLERASLVIWPLEESEYVLVGPDHEDYEQAKVVEL